MDCNASLWCRRGTSSSKSWPGCPINDVRHMVLVTTPPFSDSMGTFDGAIRMMSKKQLQEDNEELICILDEILACCEEQGCVLPLDLSERVAEFLILDDEEDEGDVIEIKPTS